MDSASQSIAHYHEKTKHHYHRYARSAEYMDWENQPQPFRFCREAPVVELPLLKQDPAGNCRVQLLFAGHDCPVQGTGHPPSAGQKTLTLYLGPCTMHL